MTKTLRDPWLVLALTAGVALRLYGIDHGLPHVYNPDEANIMARSLALAQSLNPDYFLYPSLLFYLIFGLMGAMFVGGRLVGRYEDLAAFQRLFFEDPTDFYLVARLLGVVTAAATIVLTYRLASKHFGNPVARTAAILIAISFHHVRDSHYIKHDVPAGLALVIVLIALDQLMDRRTRLRLVVVGVVVGIGFALHYYMIFLAPLVVACHLATYGKDSAKRFTDLVVIGTVASATFFVLSPFVLVHFSTAMEHMAANRQVVVDRSLDAGGWFPSMPLYGHFMMEQAYGYVWSLLILVGVGVLIRRGARLTTLWLGFVVPFALFIGYTFFAGRYLNPVAAPLAVSAALGLDALASRIGWKIGLVVGILASVQPIAGSLTMARLFAAEDTRTLARQWVVSQIPSGASVAVQSYSVPVPRSAENLRSALSATGADEELERRGKFSFLVEVAEAAQPSYDVTFLGEGDEKDREYVDYHAFEEGLAALTDANIDYLILRYAPQRIPSNLRSLFRHVALDAHLVHRVTPFVSEAEAGEPSKALPSRAPYLDNEDWPVTGSLTNKGPVVEIYAVGESP